MCLSMYSGGSSEGNLLLTGHTGWSSKCLIRLKEQKTSVIINTYNIRYTGKVWWRKVWRIDSFRAFGKRKFGKLIDQPIDHEM